MLEHGKDGGENRIWKQVDGNFAISKIGLILNSSIKCVIYSCFGSSFRKEVLKLLCCGRYVGVNKVHPSTNATSLHVSVSTNLVSRPHSDSISVVKEVSVVGQ